MLDDKQLLIKLYNILIIKDKFTMHSIYKEFKKIFVNELNDLEINILIAIFNDLNIPKNNLELKLGAFLVKLKHGELDYIINPKPRKKKTKLVCKHCGK